jgi:hypothetical protein
MGLGGSKIDPFLQEMQECLSISVAVNEQRIECGETTFHGYVRVDCTKAMRKHKIHHVTVVACGEVHSKIKIVKRDHEKQRDEDEPHKKNTVILDNDQIYQLERISVTVPVHKQFTEVGSTQYFPFEMKLPAYETTPERTDKFIPGTIHPFALAKSFTYANYKGIPYNRGNSYVEGTAEVIHRVLVSATDVSNNQQWVASSPIMVVPKYLPLEKISHSLHSTMLVNTNFLYCIPAGDLTATLRCANSAVYKDGIIPCTVEVVNHTKLPVDIITLELKADVCISLLGSATNSHARVNGTVNVWSGQLDGVAAGETSRPVVNVPMSSNGLGTSTVDCPTLEIRYYLVLTAKTNCFQDDAQAIISIDVLSNNSHLVNQTIENISRQGNPPPPFVNHAGPAANSNRHSFRRAASVNETEYETMSGIPIAEPSAYDPNYGKH